MAQKGAPMQVG